MKYKTAEEHRDLITRLYCSHSEWRVNQYPQYKQYGYLAAPDQKYDLPWSWFKGIDQMASAEQHRKWMSKGQYDVQRWKNEGYPHYKREGAVYYPPRKFDLPWEWFLGEDKQTVDYSLSDEFFGAFNTFRCENGYHNIIGDVNDSQIWSVGFLMDGGVIGGIHSIGVIDEGIYYFVEEDGKYIFELELEDD